MFSVASGYCHLTLPHQGTESPHSSRFFLVALLPWDRWQSQRGKAGQFHFECFVLLPTLFCCPGLLVPQHELTCTCQQMRHLLQPPEIDSSNYTHCVCCSCLSYFNLKYLPHSMSNAVMLLRLWSLLSAEIASASSQTNPELCCCCNITTSYLLRLAWPLTEISIKMGTLESAKRPL